VDVERRLGIGRTPPALVAASLGAAWGVLGYAVLWGHTPLFPSRSFVVGPVGTAVLAPVRIVLWGIRVVEQRFASPFEFAQNNAWIGVLAGLAGAGMCAGGFLLVRGLVRRTRR
jgi:hypothetical protein